VSLLLSNNTSDSHSFQLPEPRFQWWLRLNTADVPNADREIEQPAIDVAAHSVQLLTAIVAAAAAEPVASPIHAALAEGVGPSEVAPPDVAPSEAEPSDVVSAAVVTASG
jgi:hypothetical protein